MPHDPILLMRGVNKVFPGVHALKNVDFTLRHGQIHALLPASTPMTAEP